MSSHFTYEIDERKLRVKLKDIETPPSDEAWQKFEAYSNSLNKSHGHNPLKDVKLPLNRNIIIPVVFGALIIIFSVILFNFIDIKKPAESGAGSETKIQVTEAKPDSSLSTQTVAAQTQNNKPEPITVTAVNTPTVAAAKTNTVAAIVTNTIVKPVTTVTVAALNRIPATTLTNTARTTPTLAVALQNTLSAEAQAELKKKKKRRNVEVVETDSSFDSRPALGSEDRDTGGGRPN